VFACQDKPLNLQAANEKFDKEAERKKIAPAGAPAAEGDDGSISRAAALGDCFFCAGDDAIQTVSLSKPIAAPAYNKESSFFDTLGAGNDGGARLRRDEERK
jgi:hypothetical protein